MLICGEIHYYRVPKPLWRDRLLKLKRAGSNCVSTYIPWNWHSPHEDIVDFQDRYKQWHVPEFYSRNLSEFIKIASQLGLKVIARPGPYICSEWDSGGHPNWLYNKTCKLRSLDPIYMEHAKKWYEKVYRVLKLFIDENIVVGIQVENEYFWGNEKYIEELYNIMKKLAPETLVFTNENYYLSRIPNTIDDYPAPWDIKPFEEKLKRYLSQQPGLFKMFAELEGGWFKAIRYGYNPTNRLSIPAEWTELLIKTGLGMGLDNYNIYMFHGGSNPGYYTAKYVDSSYDFEASIREWGELSERYYKLKRVFMFMNSFRELIEKTKFVQGAIRPASTNCSDIFARISERGKIIVLRNKTDFTCYEKIVYEDKIIPEKNQIRVPPRYAKIIVLDFEVKGTPFKINYITGEILLWKNINEHTVALIIYGDPGELTETEITYKDDVKLLRVHGDITYSIEQAQRRIIINAQHGGSDSIFIAESISGKRLVIVYTTKSRAEKTWVLDHTVIVSNTYFMSEYRSDNKSLCVESELDINSCGEFTVLTPLEIEKMLIGESLVEIKKIAENVYNVIIPQHLCKGMEARNYQADSAVLMEDPLWDKGRKIKPASPLEKNGYYENGIYVYKIKFDIDESVLSKLSNKILGLVGFSDYAVMTINGDYIASGYHYIEGNVDKSLREGINELTVILESTGHPNDGFLYVPNGIYTGIYLGKKQDIPLNTWYKIDAKLSIGPDFDFAEFLSNPEEIMRILSKIDSYEKKLVNFIDAQGLYITEIQIYNPRHYYIFDPSDAFYYNHYGRILLFINDVYIGPVIGPIDITKYLKPGVNRIALFVEWGVISPLIRVFEHKIDGEWYVQEGTKGLIDKWYLKPIDKASMETIPLMLRNLAGKVYWIKAKINYDKEPSSLHPVKLLIDSWGMRLGIFVNGQFIGRICDDSVKKELYVPEPAIRKGSNDILLFAIITSDNAGIGRIELREIYEHKKKDICFYKET